MAKKKKGMFGKFVEKLDKKMEKKSKEKKCCCDGDGKGSCCSK